MVGRATELAGLSDCLDACAAGHGRTLFLAGESGIGKTRLAETAREEAVRRDWGFAIGRANAVETALPYALLADALLPTIQSLSPQARALMTRGLLDELALLFPALSQLRGGDERVPRSHEWSDFRNRLFWNFAQFLKELTHAVPLLVVVEDLHWADPSSLELLHFLARQTTNAKVAIVCTYRSDADSSSEALMRMERSLVALTVATVLPIRPLTYADTDELVRRVFAIPETVSRPFTALLFGWTRGNPFFIEEVLKTLVESGRLRFENGAWLGWELETLKLPPSVRDTVMLRVRRLSAEARRVAELTAVLGGRTRIQVLQAATGLTAGALLPALAELQQSRVLDELESGDSVSYDFAHPLVRETLLAELGRGRAGVLHGMVAKALERHYGAASVQHAAELAYHYARALDRQLEDKAMHYLEVAGRQALAAYANHEALTCLRAALDRVESGAVTPGARETARLMAAVAHAHQRLGDTDAAVPLWQRARELASGQGDAGTVCDIERRLGLAFYWTGRAEQALAHLEAAAAAAATAGDEARRTSVEVARGLCLQELGRSAEAVERLHAALRLAEKQGSPRLLASAHRALLLLHLWTGPPKVAREHGERALALAAATDDAVLSFWAHWAMAMLGGLTGDSVRAAAHLDRCSQLAEELRSPLLRLWTAEGEIEFAFGEGRWDEGLALGGHAISMARALHQSMLLPRLLVWTALIQLGRADTVRAKAYIDEAWSLSGAGSARPAPPSVHSVIPAYIGRAAYHLAIGEYEEAIRVAEAGLAVVEATGYEIWAIHRLIPIAAEAALYLHDLQRAAEFGGRLRRYAERFEHRLGLAWADACDALTVWLRGDPARGAELMRRAAEALEAIPFLPDATRLRRQLAGRLAEIGDRDGALRELRHVHDMLVRLGAEQELERTREQFRQLDARPPARASTQGAVGLTGRELEIARAIARNKSNKAISAEMKISLRTVTTHVSNIFRKLEVGSRREVAEAIRAAELGGEINRH